MKDSCLQCVRYHGVVDNCATTCCAPLQHVTDMALLQPDEDIAAIAKQISDHAEAIYQTWKSRGLAPTEILKCHSSATAADKFGSALRPRPSQLERLVNTFVVEDKAARQTTSSSSSSVSLVQTQTTQCQSSIKSAVQRFEPRAHPTTISRPAPANPQTLDTIEVIFPEEIVRRDSPAPSWPLKNRAARSSAVDEVAREEERLIAALQAGTVVDERKAPHPELTAQQKQHLRQAGQPVRPFLTRGSVAERVLIFEKCPTELLDKRRSAPAVTAWRGGADLKNRAQVSSPKSAMTVRTWRSRRRRGCYACDALSCQPQCLDDKPRFIYQPPSLTRPRSYNKTYAKEKENQRKSQPLAHTTLQRHTKATNNQLIPRFYFPSGRPVSQSQADAVLGRIASEFRTFPQGHVPRDKFHVIVKACELPLYWKSPLFLAAATPKQPYVDARTFLEFWKQLTLNNHDVATRFVRLLTRGEQRNVLLPEDFIPLVQDVVDTHPGLTFLKEATEFHSRYVHTVIARIYYCVNRSWSGRISVAELRRSNLLQIIAALETEEDINQITQYFSYEHFYVIYCKFWELDLDHDLFIGREDLARHNDHALSSRIIDRIVSGAVTRGGTKADPEKMSYTEFVWFLLSEEDKQHPTAIEYWFRCMDLDGDGYLSMYELEYFYEEQLRRMEFLGIETLPFEDCLCQMLDMVRPKREGCIALADLKKCRMVPIFFDTFFNLEKYLDHEQKDPFASQRDPDDAEMSDWDRFAAEEYELLVAEEGGADNADDLVTELADDVVRIKVTVEPEQASEADKGGTDGETKMINGHHEWPSPPSSIDIDLDNSDSSLNV